MANTDDDQIKEKFGLLIDSDASIDALLNMEATAAAQSAEQVQSVLEQSTATAASIAAQPKPLTAAQQLKEDQRQAKLLEEEQLLITNAEGEINKLFDSFDLTPDQAQLSRQSGELDAVIAYRLQKDLDRLGTSTLESSARKRDVLTRALQLHQQNAAEYQQQAAQQGIQAADYRTLLANDAERVADLADGKNFGERFGDLAGAALSGIPGAAAIGASAIGLEGTGQFLGGIASGIREGLGSESLEENAAFAVLNDIKNRTQLPEGDPRRLSYGEAFAEAGASGIDGDVLMSVLTGTVGAFAGGGVISAGIKGAAKVLGAAGTKLGIGGSNAASAVGAAAGRAGSALETAGAPAIAAGLGSGVDQELTTPQARVLLGTGAVSAGLGAAVAGSGIASTAEQALGRATRAITPKPKPKPVTPPPGSKVPPVPSTRPAPATSSTPAGVIGAGARQNVAGNATVNAIGGIAAEGTQEFVESAGEDLAQSAQTQGVIGALSNPAARSSALAAGITAAPLGGAVGSVTGATSGAIDASSNNARIEEDLATLDQAAAENAAFDKQAIQREIDETEIIAREDLAAREAENAKLAAQREQASQQRVVVESQGLEALSTVLQEEADLQAREAAVQARQAELNDTLTQQAGRQVQVTEDTPLEQIGQLEPVKATLANSFNPTAVLTNFPTVQSMQTFVERLQSVKADETTLRALYRNQAEETPEEFSQFGEDVFVQRIQAIPDQGITLRQAVEAAEAAMVEAGATVAPLQEEGTFADLEFADAQAQAQFDEQLAAEDAVSTEVLNEQQEAEAQAAATDAATVAEQQKESDTVAKEQQKINDEITKRLNQTTEVNLDTPVESVSGTQAVTATFENSLNPFSLLAESSPTTPDQIQDFMDELGKLQKSETRARALYRNQAAEAEGTLTEGAEEAFVQGIKAIPTQGVTVRETAQATADLISGLETVAEDAAPVAPVDVEAKTTSSAELFDVADNNVVLKQDAIDLIERLTSVNGEAFEGISNRDRRNYISPRRNQKARAKLAQLAKLPNLNPAQQQELATEIDVLKEKFPRKKR